MAATDVTSDLIGRLAPGQAGALLSPAPAPPTLSIPGLDWAQAGPGIHPLNNTLSQLPPNCGHYQLAGELLKKYELFTDIWAAMFLITRKKGRCSNQIAAINHHLLAAGYNKHLTFVHLSNTEHADKCHMIIE